MCRFLNVLPIFVCYYCFIITIKSSLCERIIFPRDPDGKNETTLYESHNEQDDLPMCLFGEAHSMNTTHNVVRLQRFARCWPARPICMVAVAGSTDNETDDLLDNSTTIYYQAVFSCVEPDHPFMYFCKDFDVRYNFSNDSIGFVVCSSDHSGQVKVFKEEFGVLDLHNFSIVVKLPDIAHLTDFDKSYYQDKSADGYLYLFLYIGLFAVIVIFYKGEGYFDTWLHKFASVKDRKHRRRRDLAGDLRYSLLNFDFHQQSATDSQSRASHSAETNARRKSCEQPSGNMSREMLQLNDGEWSLESSDESEAMAKHNRPRPKSHLLPKIKSSDKQKLIKAQSLASARDISDQKPLLGGKSNIRTKLSNTKSGGIKRELELDAMDTQSADKASR